MVYGRDGHGAQLFMKLRCHLTFPATPRRVFLQRMHIVLSCGAFTQPAARLACQSAQFSRSLSHKRPRNTSVALARTPGFWYHQLYCYNTGTIWLTNQSIVSSMYVLIRSRGDVPSYTLCPKTRQLLVAPNLLYCDNLLCMIKYNPFNRNCH